jgi:hypothetical protein
MKGATLLTALAAIAAVAAFASPAAAAVAAGDHYQCYKIKGKFEKVPIELQDQFATELKEAVAIKPVLLCNPTRKDHDGTIFPIQDDELHYVCYTIKTEKFDKREVAIFNQFQSNAALTVIKPKMLCVPSQKGGAGS